MPARQPAVALAAGGADGVDDHGRLGSPATTLARARYPRPSVSDANNPAPRDMDRWLGDGGMPIIGALGGTFDAYGHDHDGWVSGRWVPTALACNPRGIVQAGVHAVIHDGAMNFAINAGLPRAIAPGRPSR